MSYLTQAMVYDAHLDEEERLLRENGYEYLESSTGMDDNTVYRKTTGVGNIDIHIFQTMTMRKPKYRVIGHVSDRFAEVEHDGIVVDRIDRAILFGKYIEKILNSKSQEESKQILEEGRRVLFAQKD